jgi:hypothetical protein
MEERGGEDKAGKSVNAADENYHHTSYIRTVFAFKRRIYLFLV